MSGTLQLDVACPECRTSLMDPVHLIDHVPSVRAVIKVDGRRGWLRLSSVYGSYAIDSDLEIPHGEVADFFCPDCGSTLSSEVACDLCGAPLVSFRLSSGGCINICARRGCKKHFLEFQNGVMALSRLYDANSIGGSTLSVNPLTERHAYGDEDAHKREMIRHGAFLDSYCPHCQQSLITPRGIQLHVLNRDRSEGDLLLSPYLNVFNHESTVEIPDSEEVLDLKCPQCHHSLMIPEQSCDACGSRIAGINVSAMHKYITFYICMKKGCRWHGVSREDTRLIALEDSAEW